jgi:beta-galactosidase
MDYYCEWRDGRAASVRDLEGYERIARQREPPATPGRWQPRDQDRLGDGAAGFTSIYRLAGDGSMSVSGRFPPPTSPTCRISLALSLPRDLDTVQWYGRGPHESYVDRKTSTLIGP